MKKVESKNAKAIQSASDQSLKTLAVNLKLLRGLRGMSQEELAEICGMKRTQISELERQLHGVQLSTLTRLSAALDVQLWELLKPRDKTGR